MTLIELIYFIVVFVASCFSVYRLSWMIGTEDGPLDVFSNLRGYIGQKNWIGRGMNCPNCISFWISMPFTAYLVTRFAFFTTIEVIILWLGISGIALFIIKKSR